MSSFSIRLNQGIMLSTILCLLLSVSIYAQESEKRVNYSDPTTWLLGDFTQDQLLSYPHAAWFEEGFDAYEFDNDAFIELEKTGFDDINIIVVLGTWCPDSRREVPRFMKILESTGYKQDNLRFIGVDSNKEAPVDDYEALNIDRVPTFIFYRDKVELGRIIEYPATSLERDMLNILLPEEE